MTCDIYHRWSSHKNWLAQLIITIINTWDLWVKFGDISIIWAWTIAVDVHVTGKMFWVCLTIVVFDLVPLKWFDHCWTSPMNYPIFFYFFWVPVLLLIWEAVGRLWNSVQPVMVGQWTKEVKITLIRNMLFLFGIKIHKICKTLFICHLGKKNLINSCLCTVYTSLNMFLQSQSHCGCTCVCERESRKLWCLWNVSLSAYILYICWFLRYLWGVGTQGWWIRLSWKRCPQG